MGKKRKKFKKVPLKTVYNGTKHVEPICNNCLCYDRKKGHCKVVVFINGNRFNLPVFPGDHCHMDELGIEVKQVRWWVEDKNTGKPTKGNGVVKIEYPGEEFFYNKVLDQDELPDNYFPDAKEKPPLPPSPEA